MAEAKKQKVHGVECKAMLGRETVGEMKSINKLAQQHDIHQ
jgi:hypothetical protein